MDYLNVFGLIANVVGALFLAFSIKVVDLAKNANSAQRAFIKISALEALIKYGDSTKTITSSNKTMR